MNGLLILTLFRRRKTSTILLLPTPDDFTRQRGSFRLERDNDCFEQLYMDIIEI